MAIGTMLDIKIHVEDTNCFLDSYARTFFTYTGTPFSDGDATVVKDDISNTLNDGYQVKVLYTEGNDPGPGMPRFQMLDIARGAVLTCLNEDITGLTKIA